MNKSMVGIFILAIISCGHTNSQRQDLQSPAQQETDTCDSPDAHIGCSFATMPKTLTNVMTMAGENEPGERLTISGTIYKEDGKTPYPGVIIYAYHTDSKGLYSKNGSETSAQKWHGRLHGWCETGDSGQYEIHTIKPARYPNNSMPAHIHAAIKKDNGQMYWITDYVFTGDDLVNREYLTSLANVGGTGVVDIRKDDENIWTGVRDIVLPK